jgi:hypothetical protein
MPMCFQPGHDHMFCKCIDIYIMHNMTDYMFNLKLAYCHSLATWGNMHRTHFSLLWQIDCALNPSLCQSYLKYISNG